MTERVLEKKWDPAEHLVMMGMSRQEANAWLRNGENSASLRGTSTRVDNSLWTGGKNLGGLVQALSSRIGQLGRWWIFPFSVCGCDFVIWILALEIWHPPLLYSIGTIAAISLIEAYCLKIMLSIKSVHAT